jgi:hypothetical protein
MAICGSNLDHSGGRRLHDPAPTAPTAFSLGRRRVWPDLSASSTACAQAIAYPSNGNNRFAVAFDRLSKHVLHFCSCGEMFDERSQHLFRVNHENLPIASDAISPHFD